MKIKVDRKFKNEKEKKKYESAKRAKELLKGKALNKLTRTEKDELLFEIARILDIID